MATHDSNDEYGSFDFDFTKFVVENFDLQTNVLPDNDTFPRNVGNSFSLIIHISIVQRNGKADSLAKSTLSLRSPSPSLIPWSDFGSCLEPTLMKCG